MSDNYVLSKNTVKEFYILGNWDMIILDIKFWVYLFLVCVFCYFIEVYCVKYYDLIFGNEIVERSTLAKVGNQCIQFKGVNACFVIGKTNEDEVRISARSDGTINVQILMEKMGGGGHFASAANCTKNTTIKAVETSLLDVLSTYLSDARTKKNDEKGN